MTLPDQPPENPTPAVLLADLLVCIDHVGIAVADLTAGIRFWSEVAGLRLVHTETNAEQGVHEAMLVAEDGPTRLQLLAPASDDSAIARFLTRSGPGLQQLALRVTDLVAASERLRGHGLRLLYDEPATGTGGSLINFVHPRDAGGVLLELVQVTAAPEPQ